MSETLITDELSNSKVAAVFADAGRAHDAARDVAAALSLDAAQVKVISPAEPNPGRKLEPESGGIWRTIVTAHIKLGILGAVAGLVAFAVMHGMGIRYITSSPVAAGLVLLFFGAVGGLFLGGLVSLRPDHDPYVLAARDAMDSGRTTVVVHAFTAAQADEAAEYLRGRGGEVTSTL